LDWLITINLFIDYENQVYFILETNIFQNNFASDNGGCIYILNLNSSGQIVLLNNVFISNGILFVKIDNMSLGSIVYLENPSNLSIQDSTFFNNSGIVGTCIYYSESNQNYSFILQKNIFSYNNALLVAGVIYFAQLDQNVNSEIQQNNKFMNNKAGYGDNLSSAPFRIKNNDNLKNFDSPNFKNQITMIPGITALNFSFSIVDFFNQTIINMMGSYCIIRLKNVVDFSDIDLQSTISFEGFSTADVINGFSL